MEISEPDAERLGVAEGDVVRVESPRGSIDVRARVGAVMEGAVFDEQHRQANELTMTVWGPVSKQPYFKTAACRVSKVRTGDGPAPAPTTTASAPVAAGVPPTEGGDPTEWRLLDETPSSLNHPSTTGAGGA